MARRSPADPRNPDLGISNPPRFGYVLTPMGQEFMDVLMALVAWGRPLDGGRVRPARPLPPPRLRHVEPHCSVCGEPMRSTDVDLEPGPGR